MSEYPVLNLAAQRPDRGHYVYRFYDSEGVLLYVGSSGDPAKRKAQRFRQQTRRLAAAGQRTFEEAG